MVWRIGKSGLNWIHSTSTTKVPNFLFVFLNAYATFESSIMSTDLSIIEEKLWWRILSMLSRRYTNRWSFMSARKQFRLYLADLVRVIRTYADPSLSLDARFLALVRTIQQYGLGMRSEDSLYACMYSAWYWILHSNNSENCERSFGMRRICPFNSERGIHRRRTMSDQSKVFCSFLTRYTELHSMLCPRGRSSEDEIPLLLLPSSTTYTAVYNECRQQWSTIASAAVVEKFITSEPNSPLLFQQFSRVSKEYFSTLRIVPLVSDFSDFCIITSNEMTYASDDTKTLLIEQLNFHKNGAKRE